jgi:hypothetical protein
MAKDILKKPLHDYWSRKANADSKALPKPTTLREPSLNEKSRKYTPTNYGLLFCCHSKSYFDVCQECRRTRKDAQVQFQAFIKKYSKSEG